MRIPGTRTIATLVATAAVVVGGGVLIASNMGFKLNFSFLGPSGSRGPGGSAGRTLLSLPFNRQVGIDKASHLRNDLVASGATPGTPGTSPLITRLITSLNAFQTYSGATTTTDFDLAAGEGYLIQLANSIQYIMIGTEQPGQAVTFVGPGGASAGRRLYAPPWHTTQVDASGLRSEILNQATPAGGTVTVTRLITSLNAFQTYSGATTTTNFPLFPGVAYLVQVNVTKTLTPATY
jgi:hypothetical protein